MEEDGVPVHVQYSLPFGLAEAPGSFGVQAFWLPEGAAKTLRMLRTEQTEQGSFRRASRASQTMFVLIEEQLISLSSKRRLHCKASISDLIET